MAFSYTIDSEVHIGGKRIVSGTYTSTGVTGGDVKTGLSTVMSFVLSPSGGAVTNCPVYNETLPLTNTDGAVTIVTGNGEIGSWIAIG